MKIASIVIFFCVGVFTAFAQEETLINGPIENGGFGGPVLKVGSFNGEVAILVGGRGGWIINHSFIIGGGGYGLVNNVKAKVLGPYGERYLNFGYGGLELEYVSESHRLINFSFQTLIGAGGLSWRDPDVRTGMRDSDSDTFFMVEPGVNVTLNVTKYFRMSGGVSYRFISGVQSPASSDPDLSGPSGVFDFPIWQVLGISHV
jgi:hypothetical protein